jgi:hypothetical protein
MASKLEKYAEEVVEKVLDGDISIEEGIQDLTKRLEPYTQVKQQLDRLMAARRALLGAGNKLTGSPGTRVTQEEVVSFMGDDEWEVVELATAMSHPETTVRSHLNRGKGDKFVKLDDGKWKVNDPEED